MTAQSPTGSGKQSAINCANRNIRNIDKSAIFAKFMRYRVQFRAGARNDIETKEKG